MKPQESHNPVEMNWVDYWDSLSNEYFWPYVQSQKPSAFPEHIPDTAAVAPSRQEKVRELT